MNRRRILQAMGALGLFVGAPSLRTRSASAGTDGYDGPYLITVHAGGGWDPTTFFDGKVSNDFVEVPYGAPATLGGFQYAPLTLRDGTTTLDTVKDFLTDVGSRLVIVNGVDTQTNNHETGTKNVWSGKSFEELPALGALFAAAKLGDQKLPVAYVSGGGYDRTANLVPLTRITSPTALRAVSLPNVINPTTAPDAWTTYHDGPTYDRIQAAAAARLDRLRESEVLPTEAEGLAGLAAAREGMAGFNELALELPTTLIQTNTAFTELGSYNDAQLTGWLRSVQLALHAFSSKQAVAANIAAGGFDTHSTHDATHQRQVGKLFLTLRYLYRLADELGLSDKLYVMIGSDFGRTPTYNAGMGKDHWNVTSMALSGPGITGGRVIGATDDELRPMRVDASDPTVLHETDATDGTRLQPAHVHRALRKHAGIDQSEAAAKFPLPVETPLDDLLG